MDSELLELIDLEMGQEARMSIVALSKPGITDQLAVAIDPHEINLNLVNYKVENSIHREIYYGRAGKELTCNTPSCILGHARVLPDLREFIGNFGIGACGPMFAVAGCGFEEDLTKAHKDHLYMLVRCRWQEEFPEQKAPNRDFVYALYRLAMLVDIRPYLERRQSCNLLVDIPQRVVDEFLGCWR